jgi:alpha-glucuronidase
MKYVLTISFFLFCIVVNLSAEDGSKLWLRYQANPVSKTETGLSVFSTVVVTESSDVLQSAIDELKIASFQMTGSEIQFSGIFKPNCLLIGTPRNKYIQSLHINKELNGLGSEGFIIRKVRLNGDSCTLIASNGDHGLLYGVFHLLRLFQTTNFPEKITIKESPSYQVRILNHWDNPDRTVERGYAGYSLWRWDELPGKLSPRYKEYARVNASIGINGSVLNNVNASPQILSKQYLLKVKALADVFRSYGIKVYLSVNFSSPAALGGLPTSDPLNKDVRKWWNDKVKEIYALIPDFGGFLVKANSEGLPGPQDYGRTHADGANMLADALKPYKGIVMWRAFVYNPGDNDRAKQAYTEFMPLDGKFHSNVIIQVKNGPVDFQPREPISPLFGGMKRTNLMPEFQITQEYLGQATHLVFLAPLWKECLDADTYSDGKGSTIAKITDGTLYANNLSAIAGVANTGEDTNWCGHQFAQANWYAFGRLAWNNKLLPEKIAREWLKMTFSQNEDFLKPVTELMLQSREAVVDYMMPMGLHHLFAWGHHYGPEPWCAVDGARPDWMPAYYHKADSIGLGFNRSATGSNAVVQYHSPLRERYNSPDSCPENLILWFHHVAWNARMKNGRTMWDELCFTYDSGVQQVREFQKIWDKSEPYVDAQRFHDVQSRLKIQVLDAVWWKDACLLYFQTFSRRPIPYSIERPVHELDDLKKIKLNLKQHN